MPRTTFAGHALHPQLVLLPGGLLPFSAVLDAMSLATGKREYSDAAYYTLAGGFVGALAAGGGRGCGLPDNSARERDQTHCQSARCDQYRGRGDDRSEPSAPQPPTRGRTGGGSTPAALSIATAAGVLVSSWYGGKMSYEQGMRVKGLSEVETVPELKIPGDNAIHNALNRLEDAVAPTGGPSTSDSREATTAMTVH
jgi:hypothetical protein